MYAKELIQRISLYGFKQTKQKQKTNNMAYRILYEGRKIYFYEIYVSSLGLSYSFDSKMLKPR